MVRDSAPGPTTSDVVRATAAAIGSRTEARWIVAHVAPGLDPRAPVSEEVRRGVEAMVERRLAGEPLQYVLGTWAFRTLELRVDRRALIPRPETEQVVSAALTELRAGYPPGPADSAGAPGHRRGPVAVDLGTGTGAIALSLAVEFQGADALEVWATDRSAAALALFEENRALLATHDPAAARRVRAVAGTWFDALPPSLAGRVDLVVSNPPYVSEAEWGALAPVVRDHEPRQALVPGPTGFEAIEAILSGARAWLAPGGCVVVELAPVQADKARRRARALGYRAPAVGADLAGRPRLLVSHWCS